jgi:hypothetical protein
LAVAPATKLKETTNATVVSILWNRMVVVLSELVSRI